MHLPDTYGGVNVPFGSVHSYSGHHLMNSSVFGFQAVHGPSLFGSFARSSHPSLNLLHHLNTRMTQFTLWHNVTFVILSFAGSMSCLCVRWYKVVQI